MLGIQVDSGLPRLEAGRRGHSRAGAVPLPYNHRVLATSLNASYQESCSAQPRRRVAASRRGSAELLAGCWFWNQSYRKLKHERSRSGGYGRLNRVQAGLGDPGGYRERRRVQAGSALAKPASDGPHKGTPQPLSEEAPSKLRIAGLQIPWEKDPGKDESGPHQELCAAVARKLKCQGASLPPSALTVVRKSFDARKDPVFVYTVDVECSAALQALQDSRVPPYKAKSIVGSLKIALRGDRSRDASPIEQKTHSGTKADPGIPRTRGTSRGPGGGSSAVVTATLQPLSGAFPQGNTRVGRGKDRGTTVVVGSGPAGLFAALGLAEAGERVVLLERGKAVEERGRDIGAFAHRKLLDPDSNFCYGEGGAGTWSDGKLTTRIGKNSGDALAVLRSLVEFGAPERILVDGKPHLGTDRLVHILRSFRARLLGLGVDIRFGTVMEDLVVNSGSSRVTGVKARAVQPCQPGSQAGSIGRQSVVILADRVVLAVGHSARDVFEVLLSHGVEIQSKDFAVGLRVEHPQQLINELQYGHAMRGSVLETAVDRGRGRVPVADYSLAEEVEVGAAVVAGRLSAEGSGTLPGSRRGCYSFCMCPGGQVVSTATSEWELCVNGMSFSRRNSRWANSALVTTVTSEDFALFASEDRGALAGVAFQRAVEREAALLGGGSFVVPVQRVTDFLDSRESTGPLPSSSYRLGVKAARLDQLYPPDITRALQTALVSFDRRMPGFVTDAALLHGAETRTSSPLRILRDPDSFESVSLRGLYPIGEGAGYAGGIVSAAADGIRAARAMLSSVGQLTA